MAPSTSLNFCRNQLIDNCEFISNKDDYISVVTEKTPGGEYKAFVLRSNDDFRESLISSEPAETLHKAFDSLLMKSCEAVYHYRDTNGFSIPPDIQKANLDADDDAASAISGGSESSTTAAFSEGDSSEDEPITPATSSVPAKQMHATVVAAADAVEAAEAITARHGDNDLSRLPLTYRDFPKKSRKSTLSAMAATAIAEIRQLPPPPRDHRSLKRDFDLDYDDESDDEDAHQHHHHHHQQISHLPLRYASQGQGQGQGRAMGSCSSSRAPPPPPGWSGPPAPPSSIRQRPLMMVPPQLQQPPPPNSGPTPAAVRVPIPPPPPAVVTHPQQKQQQQPPPHLPTSTSTQRMPMTATTRTTGPPPPPGAPGSHVQQQHHYHPHHQYQQQQQHHPGPPAPPPPAPISSGPVSSTSLSSPPYHHHYHLTNGHRNSSVGVATTAPSTTSTTNNLYDVRLTIRWFGPGVEPQRVLERVRPSIKALQEAALLYVQGHMSTFCSNSSTGNGIIMATTTTPPAPEKHQPQHGQQRNLPTIGGGGVAPGGIYKNIINGGYIRTTPLWGGLRAVVRQALFGPDPDSAYDMTAYRGDDLTKLFAAMSNSGCSIPSFDIDLVDSAGTAAAGAGAAGVMRPATQ